MKIKITDGLKADLEKVLCDNLVCMERGDYGRCYLDIFKLCPKYKIYNKYNKSDNSEEQRRETSK